MEQSFVRRLLPMIILVGFLYALYSRPGLWSAISQAVGEFSLSYPDTHVLAARMWAHGAELLKSLLGLMLIVGILEQYSNGGLFSSMQQRRPREPREANFVRAGRGAAMLALAVYLLIASGHFLGIGYLGMLSVLLRVPFEQPAWVIWLPLAGWTVLLSAGVLSLCVGVNRSRGSRDAHVAVRAACQAAIGAGLLWLEAYLPVEWTLTNIILGGCYFWAFIAGSAKLYLAVRGLPIPPRNPFGDPPVRRGGAGNIGRRPAL
jgi:hypothetical protein